MLFNPRRLSSITNCRNLGMTFLIPHDFALENYFQEAVKSFLSARYSEEHYPVTLRFSQADEYLLRDCQAAFIKTIGNMIEVTVNMFSMENAMHNFWNILIRSVVVYPRELVDAVQELIKHTLSQYENTQL